MQEINTASGTDNQAMISVGKIVHEEIIKTLQEAMIPTPEYNQDHLKMAHDAIDIMKQKIDRAIRMLQTRKLQ